MPAITLFILLYNKDACWWADCALGGTNLEEPGLIGQAAQSPNAKILESSVVWSVESTSNWLSLLVFKPEMLAKKVGALIPAAQTTNLEVI